MKYVESAHKTDELLDLIPTLKGKTLVFTATKRTADSIEGILCRNRNHFPFFLKTMLNLLLTLVMNPETKIVQRFGIPLKKKATRHYQIDIFD